MKNYRRDNWTGRNHEGLNPNEPLQFLTASSIIGDEVLNPKGEHLGSIKDIMIDLIEGKVKYFVIELGGYLGIGKKYFAFPYPFLTVDAKKGAFILDQDKEIIKNAPGFDKDHWPETNSHFFDHSYTYWGGFMGVNTGGVPY